MSRGAYIQSLAENKPFTRYYTGQALGGPGTLYAQGAIEGSLTICGWFKSDLSIFGTQFGQDYHHDIFVSTTGQIYFDMVNNSGLRLTSAQGAFPANTWTHLAGTWNQDSKAMRLYQHGGLIASKTATGEPPNATRFRVAKVTGGGCYDLRVYRTDKSAAQIMAIKNGATDREALALWWKLNGDYGDYSGLRQSPTSFTNGDLFQPL